MKTGVSRKPPPTLRQVQERVNRMNSIQQDLHGKLNQLLQARNTEKEEEEKAELIRRQVARKIQENNKLHKKNITTNNDLRY